ncbi:hypothetical protein H9Q74_008892 [Fusarium xylarioides]|nr:hypothetical protein H9Q71_006619 [Fusarium xylarioides]KAG5820426.1 hypothetical protein H9Q74_008892 [Fusarium xylarioides]
MTMAMPAHLYPGANLPLRSIPKWDYRRNDEHSFYPIGFPECKKSQSQVMPVKEVAMMILMDTLTDKPDWHKEVFDETIVQKWRDEARQQSEDGLHVRVMQDKLERGPRKPRDRIITDAAFDYCIKELRGKARYFAQSGLIPTLNGPGNTIIKSDSFINETLHRDLNRACDTLGKDQKDNVDWHPRSNDMVRNLIHPSMHNFVYDRSPFIQEEVVGVSNALDFIGEGKPVRGLTPVVRQNEFEPEFRIVSGIGLEYWSDKYQWLPANVGFREDGSAEFTSYVNNLHPTKFPEIYRTIERLIDRAIPAWDHSLREAGRLGEGTFAGRNKSRFGWIQEASDENDELWTPEFDMEEFLHTGVKLTHQELRDLEEECYHESENQVEFDEDENNRRMNEGLPPLTPNIDDETMAEVKWLKYRDAILPDPKPFEEVDYAPKQSLREKFKKDGLQIIVKMASIELTPEKPKFSAGSWHLEGQMNEKIAATALYYFDSENVMPSRVSFRMQTSSYLNDKIKTGQDSYNYLERVFGTHLGMQGGLARSCVQSYGDVDTPEGRLLAFPNVFQNRESSFKLQDPTKPGHRRFIALWLVDPHRRILSTANVPPQQKDWRTGSGEVPRGLMDVKEARAHWLKLMDERTAEKARAHWESIDYNFCEH